MEWIAPVTIGLLAVVQLIHARSWSLQKQANALQIKNGHVVMDTLGTQGKHLDLLSERIDRLERSDTMNAGQISRVAEAVKNHNRALDEIQNELARNRTPVQIAQKGDWPR